MDLKVYRWHDGAYDLEGDGVVIRDLVYAERSERNKVDLYLPGDGADNEPYPLVVFVHGGGFFKSDKTRHLSNILNVLPMGYAVAAINFRLTLADGVTYPDIRWDAIDALNYLAIHPRVDNERIILWGESHGALMVDDIVVSHRDELMFAPAGVISFYAPIDMVDYVGWKAEHGKTFFLEGRDNDTYMFGAEGDAMLAEMAKVSVLDRLTGEEPPFLLLHGELDDEIPIEYSHQFHGALTAMGVEHRMLAVPDGRHGIDNYMDPAHNAPVMQFVSDVFETGRIA